MAVVNMEEMLEQVEPDVRLAGSALTIQKLRDTARDFCHFARAWQYDAPLVSIVADQKAYTIVPLANAEPVSILYMAKDDVEVFPKDPSWLDRFVSGWRTASGDDFRFYTQESRLTFRFPAIPKTSKANAVFYRLALKPGPASEELDEDVWKDWYDVIGAGAKAQLMLMPNKPWTDVRAGAMNANVYRIGRARARIRYNKGYTDAEQSFGPAYFA